jgi:hypothetical protein
MATPTLPPDFKEFLQLLNSNGVDYLVVGGYAVAYHGYVRATADIDIWIALDPANANRAILALQEFGFQISGNQADLFLKPDNVVRLGVPPLRIEILTTVSGVDFQECFRDRLIDNLDGVPVNIISLKWLKTNKLASGRGKDLVDVEHLP